MKANKDRMKIVEGFTEIHSASFKSARKAYWKLMIASQEVKVRKGEVVLIKIDSIYLPPKTAVVHPSRLHLIPSHLRSVPPVGIPPQWPTFTSVFTSIFTLTPYSHSCSHIFIHYSL